MKMMKGRIGKLFCTLGMTVCMMAAICGCEKQAETTTDAVVAQTQEQVAKEITVTFMDGDKELGKTTATAGEVMDKSAYEEYENSEDSKFLGWYETPGFLESSKKDMTTATFDADTTLFGCFEAKEAVQDTRKWYIAGTSSTGILKDNNWANSSVEEAVREQFELKETGNVINEFTITLNLYEGDQFQIIPDWDWNGQKGFGCFTDIDETQMESGGSLGGSEDKANVNVLADGNYTITLTTNPDNAALDTLVIIRNSDLVEE